jgi:hypothetical protein
MSRSSGAAGSNAAGRGLDRDGGCTIADVRGIAGSIQAGASGSSFRHEGIHRLIVGDQSRVEWLTGPEPARA